MDNSGFIKDLKEAIIQSQNKKLMIDIAYNEFLQNQSSILKVLGNNGFLMFTENRAILCLSRAINLRICIKNKRNYVRKDFETLEHTGIEIIGTGKKELPGVIKQYFDDIKDNNLKIIVVSFIFFSIFNFEKINITGIISLSDNLLNVMSMFLSMVFVFIGFIYSDRDKAVDTYVRGGGDKYYSVDKYIMNLSTVILLMLILSSAIGNLTPEVIPQYFIELQMKNEYIDKLISCRMQYYICLFLTWICLISMIICFSSLVEYYLNDMRNKFFIDAVDEKSNSFSLPENKHE